MKATMLDDITLTPEAGSIVGFRLDGADAEALLDRGLWWVAPIGGTQFGDVIGLRLQPGVPIGESPVVLCGDGDAVTVATDLRQAVPVLLLYARGRHPSGRAALREAWGAVQDELSDLQARLGGHDLTTVASALFAEDFARFQLRPRKPPDAGFHAAASSILATLDGSEARNRFLAYGLKAMAGGVPDEPPADLGPWQRQAASLAFACARFTTELDAGMAAWRVLTGPAPLDAAIPSPPRLTWTPNVQVADANCRAAARALVRAAGDLPEEVRSDLMFVAAAKLATQPKAFDMSDYLAPVAMFDERSEPERAWNALISASFWSIRREVDRPRDQIPRLARMLAERNGWDEIAEVLGRLVAPETDPA